MEAQVARHRRPDALEQPEVQMLGDRVETVEVADRDREGIQARRGRERLGTLGRREGLSDLVVVDGLGVDVGAAAEVVWLALHEGPRALRVLDDVTRRGDDLVEGGILLCLTQVDVDELEADVDRGPRRRHARGVVQVDVHLDPVFVLVVVDHRPQVAEPDRLDLAVTDLDEHRALLGSGSPRDRDEGLLVVDVERAEGESFPPRASVQSASGIDVGHERPPVAVGGDRSDLMPLGEPRPAGARLPSAWRPASPGPTKTIGRTDDAATMGCRTRAPLQLSIVSRRWSPYEDLWLKPPVAALGSRPKPSRRAN